MALTSILRRKGREIDAVHTYSYEDRNKRFPPGDPMRTSLVAVLTAATLAGGCSADSTVIERVLVMQSAYDPMTCQEVVAKYTAADGRMKDLTTLMEKSGSPFANAIAYNTEYATARTNRKFAMEAAERKNCTLPGVPKPPEAKPPEAKPPEATPADIRPRG
jgi:hypothetical protein